MPCYNHARFVDETMRSILKQTLDDLELIVIDDASKDDSLKILQGIARNEARIKIIAQPQNRGPSRARNVGLSAAVGEFVAFCDADDLWNPDKLERQIRLLEQQPDRDITYCNSKIIDETGRLTGELFTDEFPHPPTESGQLFEALCLTNFINTQTVLARRLALRDRLMFDESLRYAEDWWLWIRLARHHLFIYDPTPLAFYRVHSQSTARTKQSGFHKSRCRIGSLNLRAHTDMPTRIKAEIWYRIGRDLCLLGKRRSGRRFIMKGISFGWTARLPLPRLARMSACLALEWAGKT
jgi:glycosyltransferase involved in cell wall biosynthesis